MGGPCVLVDDAGRAVGDAPPCTDNFQVRPFMLDGVEWQSAEQCFQALKFVRSADRERIRQLKPSEGESDSSHGMRVWSEGQRRSEIRPDWDAAKVDIMYLANLAKFRQHPELAAQLLSTGAQKLQGAPSTGWRSRSGSQESWTKWNGLIQMRIREELKPEGERDRARLETLEQEFATYLENEGGLKAPLPTFV
eukprot:TRINITY_DN67710_c0_g1_i1.p1 TRINITY_DN67710_c0_g1~~TRINITY_DN67710_c0_g1_i1.p1  ORF type:complete len:215 (-),score=30.10 TRINITY_DN67710_c0_g1_i1:39-620(-)